MKFPCFLCFFLTCYFSSIHYKVKGDYKEDQKIISLLSGKLKFSISSDLKQLTDEDLITQSPSGNQRPTAVFEDKIEKIKFSVNYGSTAATNKDLPEIKGYFEKLYKGYGGNIINSNLKTINGKKFALMEFELIDQMKNKTFNYLFLTTLSGKLLIGNYSFPTDKKIREEERATKILNSIVINN